MPDPIRLTAIDASNIGVHVRLSLQDQCYFIYEYTSHKGYTFSAANNLISNLKKKPSRSAMPGHHYKGLAITKSAGLFREALNQKWLEKATLVPVPPSKAVGHVDYDNRMERICRLIHQQADVRNIVRQNASTTASHEAAPGERATIQDLLDVYEIDESQTAPAPTAIGIVDDVLTNGTHFKAMQTVLNQRFPGVPITGLFIARRVLPDEENDAFQPL